MLLSLFSQSEVKHLCLSKDNLNKMTSAMKYSISKPDDTNYFPEGVALFGLAVSNWLFVTQFLAVLYLCRFVSLDEMRDVFSVAPTILTIATAFCCKYFSRTKLKLIVLQIVIQ